MFILKKGHQPGVYVPLRALFLVYTVKFLNFRKPENFAVRREFYFILVLGSADPIFS